MRARWYDPAAGRFISEDPAYNGGNWYAYCNSNPINLNDVTGKSSQAADINGAFELMEPASRAALLYGLGALLKMTGMKNITEGMSLMMDGFITRMFSNGVFMDPFFVGSAAADSAGVMMQAMGAVQARSGVASWITGVMLQQTAKYVDGLGEDAGDLFSGLWHHIVNPIF